MYQRQYQKLQPQTTAHLAQTMTLLNMNLDDLRQEIEKALNNNPALEVVEQRYCPGCKRHLAENQTCPTCSRPSNLTSEEAVVFISPRSDFYSTSEITENGLFGDNDKGYESISLEEYVLRQVIVDLEEDEKIIAAYILNQLDEDGFFKENLADLASYFHVPLSKINRILGVIQRAEPIGVGTSSPEEAIRVQIRILKETGTFPDEYISIAENNLEQLLKKQFKLVAKSANITLEKVQKASEFFSKNLNPFPTRAHWGSFRQPSKNDTQVYSSPDVIINYSNNNPDLPLIVEVVIPSISNLEINPIYVDAMKKSDEEIKGKLKFDYDQANLFIKCLQQRNHTMRRLMESIVLLQRDFIKKGEKYLKPITRIQISEELNVHESTISRAVANKSVQMPNGHIIPLATFFDRSLSIRAEIKNILANENKSDPFSDSVLVKKLIKLGYHVARRTVAKYRAMEGIPAAHERKMRK